MGFQNDTHEIGLEEKNLVNEAYVMYTIYTSSTKWSTRVLGKYTPRIQVWKGYLHSIFVIKQYIKGE